MILDPFQLKALGAKILSLTSFWCQSSSDKSFFKIITYSSLRCHGLSDQILAEKEEAMSLLMSLAAMEEEGLDVAAAAHELAGEMALQVQCLEVLRAVKKMDWSDLDN